MLSDPETLILAIVLPRVAAVEEASAEGAEGAAEGGEAAAAEAPAEASTEE